MDKSEGLFFMRWPPLEIERRPDAQAKHSLRNLSSVGEQLHAIGQTAEESDLSDIMALVVEAANCAVDWLSAMASTSSANEDDESHVPAGATARLFLLREKAKHAFADELIRKNRYAIALAEMQHESRTAKSVFQPRDGTKSHSAKESVFKRKGGPKIDMGTPTNRAVGRLFRIIQGYRDSWKIVSTEMHGETEEFQKDLPPIVAEIVKLEDLSPDSWEKWHDVGLQVKNALSLDIDAGNIKRAWKLWGSLSSSIPVTAVFQ